MIRSLLIANRGEIALRIARTASDLGLRTVGVAPQDDATCLHLRQMDDTVTLPGSGVRAYLDVAAIVEAATRAGCDAVHPGYGLLSERPELAQACADAGLICVGPGAETLRVLGDKPRARAAAQDVGVPLVPGSADLQGAEALADAFEAFGQKPLMIKAAAGGGGRGMAILRNADEAAALWSTCSAEAEAAFGNGQLYAERYLDPVRHIEVQIIGDGQTVTHLWERDCTLQRRFQKLVEVTPAPQLCPDLRAALLEAAVRIGTAQRYRGLGTVEFLVEPDATAQSGWYFIEVNPRLQVEHTITEAWLGLDLVAAQLHLAQGGTLHDLHLPGSPPAGGAVQARINAESQAPDGSLRPSSGPITRLHWPGGPGVRVDTHAYAGYAPHPGFDSLLGKIIVHHPTGDLPVVLAKLRRALQEAHIGGIDSTLTPILTLLGEARVADWNVSTRTADQALSAAAQSVDPFFAGPAPAEQLQGTPDLAPGLEAVTASMPATVTALNAALGDQVHAGQVLAVIEAMKMQHEVAAPCAGEITQVLVTDGETLTQGQHIAILRRDDTAEAGQHTAPPPDPDHIRPDLQRVRDHHAATLDEARPEAVARRRKREQRTARENLADLLQGGAFSEYGQLVYAAQRRRRDPDALRVATPADGIITGIGHINHDRFDADASRAALLLYDGSVLAGTQGFLGHKKTDRLLELARAQALPVIFYTEGGGGRPGDEDFADISVSGLDVMTFNLMTRLTADKPSIGVNAGYCFAGNAAVFGACDLRIATEQSWIGLGGPAMVEAGGLGHFAPTEIGPAPMQADIGLIDLLARDEAHATALARQAFGYFQGTDPDWRAPDQRLLRHAIPENRKRVYDIRAVIGGLVDCGSLLELRPRYVPGLVTGLIRIEGRPMGLIANDPMHLGGALDAGASGKAAEFLRLCGRFGLPVLSLCDTPGFMVGPAAERDGGVAQACAMIGAGAALAERLFCVVLRKGYGIGAQAMAGGSFAAPAFVISWPTGEFGAMGLEGAVTLGYKRELDAAPDPQARQALFEDLVAQSYQRGQALNVASLQEIDAVIDPADTRKWILNGLNAIPQ